MRAGKGRRAGFAGGALLACLTAPAFAASAEAPATVLRCVWNEAIAYANGSVDQRRREELIRVGAGVYQIWSNDDRAWGGNLCDEAPCHFRGGELRLSSDSAVREGGYELRHAEQRSVDIASGKAIAQVTDSTTLVLTGYEVGTTTLDEGVCRPAADPPR